MSTLQEIFPGCCRLVSSRQWQQLTDKEGDGAEFVSKVLLRQKELDLPAFLPDLARLEMARAQLKEMKAPLPERQEINYFTINPRFELLQVDWQGLVGLLREEKANCCHQPGSFVMAWMDGKDKIFISEPSKQDLLALKMVLEERDPATLANEHNLPVGVIDAALDTAVARGFILVPCSEIRRQGNQFYNKKIPAAYLEAEVFTLQWHITQACDLHCKHCYDRSSKEELSVEKAYVILDEFRGFCRERHVAGQVSFTGGNPLIYPHFLEIYRAAHDRNLGLAILGNPTGRKTLEALLAIEKPFFYQVSLEGMQEHNDAIRGAGHFQRVIDFLALLKDCGVYSMVMLTLTNKNIDQVLSLAEYLRNKADLFTFNRLSMVGEGAQLCGADPERFRVLLREYDALAKDNPVMAFKDNLFNIDRLTSGEPYFGGCAGFGCGAAFNFISLLADGEVHACRKYPSPLGSIFEKSLAEIYDNEIASRYRSGSLACHGCTIRPVCGGCPAVVHGMGKDPFVDLDPYCFMDAAEKE